MRRALVACLAMGFSCGPVGVLLILRRMSLMGDAMSHGILPGAAVGFIIGGFSFAAMSLGGFVAGIAIAVLSGLVTHYTHLREDASFAAFYLISLALGVLLVSIRGSHVDLMHLLFGSILAVDNTALFLIVAIASVTVTTLAIIYRPLVAESFDSEFLKSVSSSGLIYHLIFLILVVLNLVGGFQALGTLMAVGLMMLPAAAARFWCRELWSLALAAALIAAGSGAVGLLISYHANLPSGPAIILTAGAVYVFSLFFGFKGSLIRRWIRPKHLRH
ncbi:MAG: metal ABC transporter permease [Spirochaetia bacterium]|nr:metal ABC transporter permease [Spirochaetia bacterium]